MDDINVWVQLADNLTLVGAMIFGLVYMAKRVDKSDATAESRTQDIINDWKNLRGIQDREDENRIDNSAHRG